MTSAFTSWLAVRAGKQAKCSREHRARSFGDPRRGTSRRVAGRLFDYTFMGCTEINGPGALACVNAANPPPRHAAARPHQHTLLLREARA